MPTSAEHVRNLLSLKNKVDKRFNPILSNGQMTLGVVQKLFNLYLKYQWCLGNCSPPPHCPFDRIIIGKLALKNPPNWTTLNSPEEYLLLVEKAEQVANPLSWLNGSWKPFLGVQSIPSSLTWIRTFPLHSHTKLLIFPRHLSLKISTCYALKVDINLSSLPEVSRFAPEYFNNYLDYK